ncbi:MAG: hypothetical protein WKF68_14905 [Daejeonella sp.]
MKTLKILLASILLAPLSYAQSPCKYVKKTVKELEETTLYSTFHAGMGYIDVFRSISKEGDQLGLYITTFASHSNYSAKGIYIKLLNGAILKNEEKEVDCSYSSEDSYRYTSIYNITESDLDALLNNPIILFSVGGVEKKQDKKNAEKVMSVIRCLSSVSTTEDFK